ncbi:MAG TPA: DUF3874 domain-containing protein [Bacteroides reticulotermitis]|nr:DUF3874 domain-containing protein [Bacteroides reticulotermitis]
MKTMIMKVVETLKKLFVQTQMSVETVEHEVEVGLEGRIMQPMLLKEPQKGVKMKLVKEKPEKVGTAKSWSQAITLQLGKYLKDNFVFRYNSLTGATEYRGIHATNSFRAIDDREMNGIIVDAHLEGISCWKNDVPTLVLSNKVSAYNPFHLYVNELPRWDGIDRVTSLLLRVSNNEIWLKGGRYWLRAMLSQWSGEARLHANVLTPVLISGKQGLSKSTFCRLLMPDSLRCYFLDNLNLSAGTSPERKLVKYGLINLDEFDKIKEKQQATLKNLLQMVNVPVYHGRRLGWENESRLASFIATTNSYQILTDPTGSRRFLCVEVLKPISEQPLVHKQIYAQLKAELESGQPDYLNQEEEALLQQQNKAYYRQSPLEDVFYSCFRRPRESEKGIWLTAAEIFKVLHRFNSAALWDMSAHQLSLRLCAMGFLPKHSSCGNRYYVLNILAF